MHNKLPIDYALEYGYYYLGYAVVCRYLILKGDSISHRRHAKYLFSAAERGKLEIIKFLNEEKFDLNQIDELGESPIFKAALNNCVGIFKYLHKNGANLNITNIYGKTLKDVIDKSENELLKQYFSDNNINTFIKNDNPKSRNELENTTKSTDRTGPSIILVQSPNKLQEENKNNEICQKKILESIDSIEGFEYDPSIEDVVPQKIYTTK